MWFLVFLSSGMRHETSSAVYAYLRSTYWHAVYWTDVSYYIFKKSLWSLYHMIIWSLYLMINFQNKCFYCLVLNVGRLVRSWHKLISIYTVGQVSFWVMVSRNVFCIVSCILGWDLSDICLPSCNSPCADLRRELKCANRLPVQMARKPE